MSDFIIQLSNAIQDITLDPVAKLIGILCGAVGVGVGVILFTLILKTVVLPFDIYQRVSMRKQSLKMEQMRPELEKLQKQYANDKNMYSQKMMEVYKKNNYSMFSACLPMILMMVILIVAFNELNAFSQYANLHTYSEMAKVYNTSILRYCEEDESKVVVTEGKDANGVSYFTYKGKADDKFIYYTSNDSGIKEYRVDVEKASAYLKLNDAKKIEEYIYGEASKSAAEYFRNTKEERKFLWIKNLWYSDTYWTPSLGSYKDFTSKINKKIELEDGKKVNVKDVISEETYNVITADLNAEKVDHNGYFVLVVLSIGLMFLSQFIAMKSQKAQSDLGSVDGQGASSQKMMLIMMPVIFGIFAFTYSGAFSIYMVISSAYSILTMLVSQVFVDKAFHLREQKDLQAKYARKEFTRRDK